MNNTNSAVYTVANEPNETCDVAVIGAGPAGVAAAYGAWQRGARRVLLVDREEGPGGILKQCIHNGFGLHYFGNDMTGPEYAAEFLKRLATTGVEYRAQSMVTALSGGAFALFNPQHGPQTVRARAIVLATGCRERTRGNLAVPGTRPVGILTAGSAQRLVNLHGFLPGRRVVVLGSGDIGLIMARRLTLEGAEVSRVVEILPYAAGLPRNVVQCLHDFNIPLQLESTVTRIMGSPRIQAVEVTHKPTGRTEVLECDLLLLSVGLICENELAQLAGEKLDPLTGGPICDDTFALSQPGLYAAGNTLHVSDLVDHVSREGEAAGRQAAAFALGETGPATRRVPVRCGKGVRQVVPQFVRATGETESVELSFRVAEPMRQVRLTLKAGDRVLATKRERVCVPGEMVVWPVERRLFAECEEGCLLTAEGTPLGAEN